MADIFCSNDARALLAQKFILLLGGSTMRATYKDLILLICRNELSSLRCLRKRGEDSFEGDKRVVFSGLTKGRHYEEGREFEKFNIRIEYHFITRCYNPRIEMLLHKIKSGEMRAPDVIIMNSCVWDLSRWGPNGVDAYKDNMIKLMKLLKECLPEETLFIWATALPLSTQIKGGLLIKQLGFMQSLLRFEVMEANLFCRRLVVSYGFDVLDVHYHLRMQVHRRLEDGIHYGPLPVRFITNLILTHLSLSWAVQLPGNFMGIALERVIQGGILKSTTNSNIQLSRMPVSLSSKEAIQQNISRGRFMNRGRGHIRRKNFPTWQNDDTFIDDPRPESNWLPRCPSKSPQFPRCPPKRAQFSRCLPEQSLLLCPADERPRHSRCPSESSRFPQCTPLMQSLPRNHWKEPSFHSQHEYSWRNYANSNHARGPVRRTRRFSGRSRPY